MKAEGPANASGQRETSTYAYGDSHNPFSPSAYTDSNGSSWNYSYDSASGDLTGKSEGSAGQNPVQFTYNADGTVATATDARGKVWTYSYTNHDLTTITPPAGSAIGQTTMTYDSLHRLSTVHDGSGNTTTYAYDANDRVTSETVQNPSNATYDTVTYSYDADGNLSSRTDSASGTVNYTYDALNRLTQETKPGPVTIAYSYDAVGNLTQLSDAAGSTSYGYDNADRLTSIIDTATGATAKTITYSYNENQTSHATTVTIAYPNGASVVTTYDGGGRITALTDKLSATSNYANYTYGYGYTGTGGAADGGLRRSETESVAGDQTSYGYDSNGRLTTATTTGPDAASYAYTYDQTGNRLSQTVNGGTPTQYFYGPANELCNLAQQTAALSACASPWAYSFDANGNQIAGPGSQSFQYNPDNQTAHISTTSGVEDDTYATTTQVERLRANNSLVGDQHYTYDQLGVETRDDGATLTHYTRDPSGRIVGYRVKWNNAWQDKYLFFDAVGSTIAVTDDNANLLWKYRYDPYGRPTYTWNAAGAFYNAIRYAGYTYNSTGNLYKVGHRYYDPDTGRWTQRDAIDNPLDQHGWNPYDYAGDDPINETDPSGLCGISSWTSFGDCLHKVATVSGVVGGYCGAGAMMTGGTVELLDACALAGDSISAVASIGAAATLHGKQRRRAAIAGSITAICDFSIKVRPVFGRACATAAGILALKNG